MTYFIAVLAPGWSAVVSDRRLTGNGRTLTDEFTKVSVVDFADGRYAMGFAGLAKVGGTSIDHLLLETICDAGAGGADRLTALGRAARSMTKKFERLPVAGGERFFTAVLAGHAHTDVDMCRRRSDTGHLTPVEF